MNNRLFEVSPTPVAGIVIGYFELNEFSRWVMRSGAPATGPSIDGAAVASCWAEAGAVRRSGAELSGRA